MLAVSRTVHHLGAYPQAGPSGLGADPVTRPRRAYLHLSCSKAAAFGLHFSSLLLLSSWHTLAKDRSRAVFPAASHLVSISTFRRAFESSPPHWPEPLSHLDQKSHTPSYRVGLRRVGVANSPIILLAQRHRAT